MQAMEMRANHEACPVTIAELLGGMRLAPTLV
jgi:hypothetical protein